MHHLDAVTPKLKSLFERAYLSISPPTQAAQRKGLKRLAEDSFFQLNFNRLDSLAGDHFLAAFQNATANEDAECILHLAGVDRVAFALQSKHEVQFIDDVRLLRAEETPILYHRSDYAWSTHPQNYREFEEMITRAGELIYDKTLDYAWCHMAVRVEDLRAVLPVVKSHDLSVLAEIVIQLQESISTVTVDWLAWEDPFIFERDAATFKQEREQSLDEDRKRLAYTISALQHLSESARLKDQVPS